MSEVRSLDLPDREGAPYVPPAVGEEYTRWDLRVLVDTPQATLQNWEQDLIMIPSVVEGGRGRGSQVVYGPVNLFCARMCRELQQAGMSREVLRALVRLVESETEGCLSIRDPVFDRTWTVRFQRERESFISFDGTGCRRFILERMRERLAKQKKWDERMGR